MPPFLLDYVQIALSNLCDLRCPVCIQAAEKFAAVPRGFMTAGTFAALERGIRRGARPDTLFLFWNDEPTLHPEFAEVFAACRKMVGDGVAGGLVVSTNARRLAEFAPLLAADAPGAERTRITLSLDAVAPETYRRQRGGDLAVAAAGAEALLAARGARPHPSLTFQMVVTEWNAAEAERFAAHWSRRALFHSGRPAPVRLSRDGHAGDLVHLKCAFPWEDAAASARAKEAFRGLALGRGDAAALAEADAVARERAGEICRALLRGAVVHPDGRVSPCCVDFDGLAAFGTLGPETDLLDLVDGARARAWRWRRATRRRCPTAAGAAASRDLARRGIFSFPPPVPCGRLRCAVPPTRARRPNHVQAGTGAEPRPRGRRANFRNGEIR